MLTFDDDEVTGPASVYDPAGDGRQGAQLSHPSIRSSSSPCARTERAMLRLRAGSGLGRLLALVVLAAFTLLRGLAVGTGSIRRN